MGKNDDSKTEKKIVVESNGPYTVHGDIPLVRKEPIVSEYGEPLTWKKGETLESKGPYQLCRCGHSKNKPFCDSTHETIAFDGTETADTNATAERQEVKAGKGIVIKRDHSLCIEAGFCGNRVTNVTQMVGKSQDTQVRAQMIAMMERCPSGSWSYSLDPKGANIEPDLPQEIAVVTEIDDDGPIMGPLWVMGGIRIERADGKPFETRNRVTLCRCGLSETKPLCDGSHRERAKEIAEWSKE
ncbi:MAG: CDGSH iron-sulfur domain-containing protein [Anaerolineae bacterium]